MGLRVHICYVIMFDSTFGIVLRGINVRTDLVLHNIYTVSIMYAIV